MTNLELWNTLALGVTSLVAVALFYVWTALALAAVFRKSGEAGWKAWVPVLNGIVLLRVAGLSGWLVLLFLVPVVGFVVLIVAAHRVNLAFGRGAGMTVLAALLLPVWATVLGFGPDRWLGREGARRGAVRSSGAGSVTAAGLPAGAYPAVPPAPARSGSTIPPGGSAAPAGGWTPPPLPAQPGPALASAPAEASRTHTPVPNPHSADARGVSARRADVDSATPDAPAPASVVPAAPLDPTPDAQAPAPAVPPLPPPPVEAYGGLSRPSLPAPSPSPARSAFAEPASPPAWADDEPPAAPPADEPSAPRRASAAVDPAEWELPDEASEPSWDLDFGRASVTSEVTDAVTGAPAPVSAAPARARPLDEPPAAPAAPPVTRVPAAPAPEALREPWAPAPSPMPAEGEAFPESSGPVSAIAGAPDAGGPRSARSSVSALHTRPHIPEEDELEATVVARRKRTTWTLTGPTGARVPLTADVVIVGRRPAPDAAFAGAQLVSLDDDTRTVSKTHARLELRDDRWYITDLDSTNGVLFTTLMGTEVAATPGEATEAGERFLLGDAEVSLNRSEA